MSDNSSESSSPQSQNILHKLSSNPSQSKKIGGEPEGTELLQTHFARKDPLEGKNIGKNNRYLLQTLLKQDGVGKVYQALDTKFENKVVAIKLITIYSSIYSAAKVKQLVKNFMIEIKAISTLKCPNIVQIFDYGVTSDEMPFWGSPFYVMEYLTGQTLQDRLTKHKTLSLDFLLKIIPQLCTGLKEAHQKGIVHQNLTPNNIFLVDSGPGPEIVKIINFGVTKDISSDEQNYDTKKQARYFIETYRYASPEQCLGLPNIDQRTDIYSLGLILYEAICGTNPYNLNLNLTEAEWSNYQIKIPPKPLKEQAGMENIDSNLETIIMKCLSKSPQDRFLNIEELQNVLIVAFQDALIGELQDALANESSSQQKYNLEKDKKANHELEKNSLRLKINKEVQQPSVKTEVTSKKLPTTYLPSPKVRVKPSQLLGLLAGFVVILTGMIGIAVYMSNDSSDPYVKPIIPVWRWRPSCGDPGPPAIGSTWWPVKGNRATLTFIKNNYCGDAYITSNEAQIASFSSYYRAEKFARDISIETGLSFWVGRPSQY